MDKEIRDIYLSECWSCYWTLWASETMWGRRISLIWSTLIPEPETSPHFFILKAKRSQTTEVNQTISVLLPSGVFTFSYFTLFWQHSGNRLDHWSTMGNIMFLFPIRFLFSTHLHLTSAEPVMWYLPHRNRRKSSFPSPDMSSVTELQGADIDWWAVCGRRWVLQLH